jgi:hypothetical protein
MCTLHHTPHEPPSHITHPTLPHNIEHNLKQRRVPRTLCNRLCLKRSEKTHPLLCPAQDPRERANPDVCEETRG